MNTENSEDPVGNDALSPTPVVQVGSKRLFSGPLEFTEVILAFLTYITIGVVSVWFLGPQFRFMSIFIGAAIGFAVIKTVAAFQTRSERKGKGVSHTTKV